MMEHYLQPLFAYLHHHSHIAQVVTFFIALLESLPLLGTLIPGSVTMTIIGTLIGAGILPCLPTIGWASVGAFLGDCIGFWIGHHYSTRIHHLWPFKNHPKWLSVSEKFFNRHGGKSIVFGRFIGPARSTVPMIAGLMKLQRSRFLIAAIPSAILWAIAYMTPGILLGALALEFPPSEMTAVILIGLGIIVLLWLIFWIIQYFFKYLGRAISNKVDKLWNWLNQHHSSHWFISLITNQRDLADHYQLTMVLVALICFLAFLILLSNIVMGGPLTYLNQPVFHLLQSLRNHLSDEILVVITLLGSPLVLTSAVILFILGLAIYNDWRIICHLLLLTLTAGLIVWVGKHFFYFSPRPTGFYQVKPDSSFPSGHALFSFIILSFLAFLTAQKLEKKYRWIPYTIASVIILAVAISRLYLGAHWISDVLSSWLVGTFILLLFIVSYRRKQSAADHPSTQWCTLLGIAIILPWLVVSLFNFHKIVQQYTPYYPITKIQIEDWWNHPNNFLPLYRNNRLGKPAQPFNIQWSGNLNEIQHFLIEKGWQPLDHSRTYLQSTLHRFAVLNPESHMPIWPWLYQGNRASLILIKHIPQQQDIIELYLWSAPIQFTDSSLPLWIGCMLHHAPSVSLIPFPNHYPFSLSANDMLKEIDTAAGSIQVKEITTAAQMFNWDGNIVLIRPTQT